MKLQDKVVVVTGSGNGIGEAFAHRFTAEGAKGYCQSKVTRRERAVTL